MPSIDSVSRYVFPLTAIGQEHTAGSLGVRHVTRLRVRMSGTDAGLLATVLLAGAFYFWTAATSEPFHFAYHQTDVYNRLTDGFLHGHTYVPTRPPAGLLALANPYDPIANQPYRVWGVGDMSLYKGHLY